MKLQEKINPAKLCIDVWYTVGPGANGFDITNTDEVDSLKEGLALMRKYRDEGKHDLRMYVRDLHGDTLYNRIYFFKDGRLVFEKDNYIN